MKIRSALAMAACLLGAAATPNGQAPQARAGGPPELVTLARQIAAAPNDDARAALLAASPSVARVGLAAEICNAVLDKPGQPRDAVDAALAFALQLANSAHDADGAVLAEINLGTSQADRGNFDAAVTRLDHARAVAEAAGLLKRAGQVYANLGVLNRRRGDVDLSREAYQKGQALLEQSDAPDKLASLFNGYGALETDQGNYRAALQLYEKSLALKQRLNIGGAELAITLENIGSIYAHQNDPDLAISYYTRALAAVGPTADVATRAGIYANLGNIYRMVGRFDEAMAQFRLAADLAERADDRRTLAQALYDIGVFQMETDKPEEALATFARGLGLSEQMSDRHGMAESLLGESAILSGMGRHAEARACVARAIDAATQMGDLPVLWGAEQRMGDIEAALGHRDAAEQSYRDAIDVVEQLRLLTVGGAQQQQQAFEARQDPYRSLVTFLAGNGRVEDALLTLERARARTLLDVLQQGGPALSPVLSPAEARRERALNEAFVVLSKTLVSNRGRAPASDPRMRDLVSKVQAARRDLDDFHVQVDAAHPELRTQRGDVPALTIGDLDALLPSPATIAIEYFAANTQVYAFVARRTSDAGTGRSPIRLTVHRLPISRDDLHTRAADFRRRIADRDLNIRPAARQLYDDLIAPLGADMAGATDWAIVPDQELWEVPFQALIAPDGRYVVERAATALVPSLSALRAMQASQSRRPAAPRTQTAFIIGSAGDGSAGSQALTEAEHQAMAIGRVYGAQAQVVTGADATTRRFAAGAGQFTILHISSHGVLDDVSPLHSYIALSPLKSDAADTGRLEAGDVMRMRLGADLVVLSGCETGRGRSTNGEGLIGLSWALFAAGAPSAIVSQWKVDAVSTTALMTDFHRAISAELTKSGRVQDRARALQQAALKMLRAGTYAHPFYWAPFVLMGNGS